jgi:hypothetical protein
VDDEQAELTSARADLESLQIHNERVTIVVGPILLFAGVVILALGIQFRLDRLPVVGPLAGWAGYLLTFGGFCTIVMLFVNRRDRRRTRRAEQDPN